MFLRSLLFRAFPLVFVCLCSADLASATEANSSFMGNPGTDVEAARAKLRDKRTDRLRWELATTIDAYNRIGTKNPRWYEAAQSALKGYGEFLAKNCDNDCGENLKGAFEKALAAGCDDPLVVYFSLRLGCYPAETSSVDLAKLYSNVEERLQASEYPPIRKCFASVRAAQQAMQASHGETRLSATQASDLLHSVPSLLRRAETEFEEVVQDPSANRDSVYELEENALLEVAKETPFACTTVFDPLGKFFDNRRAVISNGDTSTTSSPCACKTNKPKITTNGTPAGLIEGTFWVLSAWNARGSGWSNTVSDPGWKLFNERLQKAQTILEKAWAIDPSDPNIAIEMMNVELGQGLGRERLETWFRRAMDADPDSCRAAHGKMLYLEPKWYGTEEELMEFAHQCVATGNWKSRIPFVLISAHSDLAGASRQSNDYWKQPEVWNEVEKFYMAAFAHNPDSPYDRSYYALIAYRAEKWKLADELFSVLGDKPDLIALKCSMANYDQMRKYAATKAQTE